MPLYLPFRSVEVDVVNDYALKGDAMSVGDAAMTSGLATITCATSQPFTTTAIDGGKSFSIPGAGVSGAALAGTIVSVTDSSHAVASVAASTTVANKTLTFYSDDLPGLTAFFNDVNAFAFKGLRAGFKQTATNRFGYSDALPTLRGPIWLAGQGCSHTADTGDYTRTGGTWLVPIWAASDRGLGAALAVAPTAGLTNTAIDGLHLEGFNIDCRNGDQNNPLFGLQLLSNHGYHLNDLFVIDALAVAYDFGVISPGVATPAAGSLGEAKDNTRGILERFCARLLEGFHTGSIGSTTTSGTGTFSASFSLALTAAGGLPTAGWVWVMSNLGYPVLVKYTGGGGTTTLTGCVVDALTLINAPTWLAGAAVAQSVPGNGSPIRLNGDIGANACCASIRDGQLSYSGTATAAGCAAIEFLNSDSMLVQNIMINRATGTAPGHRYNGSNTSASLAARNNQVNGGSAGLGGTVAKALDTALAALTFPAVDNYWDRYQTGNGEPAPTIEEKVAGVVAASPYKFTLNGAVLDCVTGLASLTAAVGPIANTETQIIAKVLGPGQLRAGTVLRIRASGSGTAASATAGSIFRVRVGTQTLTGTVLNAALSGTSASGTTNWSVEYLIAVRTAGAGGTAIAGGPRLNGAAVGMQGVTVLIDQATAAGAVDTTKANIVELTYISGVSTTSITVHIAEIEVVRA